jgi:hypothetical protein
MRIKSPRAFADGLSAQGFCIPWPVPLHIALTGCHQSHRAHGFQSQPKDTKVVNRDLVTDEHLSG